MEHSGIETETQLEQKVFLNQHNVETKPVAFNRKQLADALEHDREFLIQYFLGDELDVPVPEFHVDSLTLMCSTAIARVALALPRGHAKTTLAKLGCVWYFLFSSSRFIIYISSTLANSVEACKDIVGFIDSDNGRALLGHVDFRVRQEGRGVYKFVIQMPNRFDHQGNPIEKTCILRAIGAGQHLRGINMDNERPEVAVIDDLEDDDNIATQALRQKLKNWFFGPFYKCLSKKNPKVIMIGNMISHQGLLYQFVEKSNLWYSRRKGCLLANGEPLWPDKWSLEDIASDFREYKNNGMTGRWFAEMMNIPMPDSSPLIKVDEIFYRPALDPSVAEVCFLTVDPAISMESWADKTAIVAHAYTNNFGWGVGTYIEERMEPETLFLSIMKMCQMWHTTVVAIEAASYQKALSFLFRIYMEQYGFHFEIIELPHKNRSKTERLAAWTSLIRTKAYAIADNDLAITEQLLNYDPSKKENHDDLIDACSMFVPMSQHYMDVVLNQFEIDDHRFDVVGTYQTAGN